MKRTLVIVAFSTLVSCSTPSYPAATPTTVDSAVRLYTTTAAFPLVHDLTSAYTDTVTFETRTANYRTTLDRLLDGETPYFVTNHLPPPEELTLWAAPLALDGIAVIVHPDNAILNLTSDDLRAIFQGRVSNWRDLGGSDLDLTVVSRETGSGTRAEFGRLIMGSRSTTNAAVIAPSSDAVIQRVAETPGAVGYVSQALLNDRVRAVTIDGIPCDLPHIADHTYPLRTTLFVAGLAEPQDPLRAFIGWVQTQDGQQVVAQRHAPLVSIPVP